MSNGYCERCDAESYGSDLCSTCEMAEQRDRLAAENARLREALAGFVEYERKRHPPKMGGDHYPPSLAPLMKRAREALGEVES